MLEKINLNGRGSNKETIHVELSLEGSGITYEPGDVLAIIRRNNEQVVDLLVSALNFEAQQLYRLKMGHHIFERSINNEFRYYSVVKTVTY